EMSSARTAGLILIVVCLAVSSALAQQQRRGRPAPKTAGGEAKDPREQAAELFEAGQNAHQKGELEKAVGLYGEALERDPSLWQAEFQRAAAYFSLNRLAEAKTSMLGALKQLSEFGDAPEARTASSRAQTLLGEIALAGNDPVEAEKSFRRALELNPQAARARAGLAEILLGGGKYAEAIAEAKAAIEAGDDRATVYALLGEAQTLGGKYDEALASLNEALKRETKNVVALRRRAEVYLAGNDLKAAIEDLRASAEVEPNVPNRLRLAGALAAAKRYDEAVSLYQRILQDEPSNNEARTALAAVMIESGKGAEAVAQLEALIKAEPNRADLRAQLAELYLPAQPEKALEQYLAAAKIDPSQTAHQIGVAASLVKLGRFQEAVGASRQALAQNPKEDVAYFARTNLATALFKLDDFQNAAVEYVRILDHQRKRGDRKRTAITLYFLGICFDKLGDYEQALKAYEQFMALASADNQLEIDKVNLRLPTLRNQIKEGKGKRKK
ncbi:MAG TPA: tetratricopeptide repeat protein, partial [Blastocatellia bacterium]|nr:tetratricopeptide repeat protein [Blastocatellia bacterium]